jgi:hypothetical protein
VKRIAIMALTTLAIFGAAGAALLYRKTSAFNLWPVVLAGAILATALALVSRRTGSVAALAVFIAGSWQLFGWWAAPVMDGARSGRDLMARVAKALPPASELGLAGWKEQLLLHVDRPVFHFGFRRAAADETRDAAAWLGQGTGRRLLIPVDQMAPCLDPQAGEALGQRHRKAWRLVAAEAITAACAGEPIERLRRYDPRRGRLLPTSEDEPDA